MDKNSAKYLSPLMLLWQKTDLLVCENYSRFSTEIKIMQYVCLLPKYFAHRAKYGIYNCIAGKIKAIAFKKKEIRVTLKETVPNHSSRIASLKMYNLYWNRRKSWMLNTQWMEMSKQECTGQHCICKFGKTIQ